MFHNKNMKLFFYLQKLRKETPFNFYDLIYIYLFGGLLGSTYEEIFYLITTGKFVNSSGSLFLPFNVVYGSGIILVTLCFYKISNWLLIWFFSSLLCGFLEYFMSYFSELIFNAVSWNYSSLNMSINGRTTIPFMVLWGLGSMFIVTCVIPFFLVLIHKINKNTHKITSIISLIIIFIDWSFSFYAVLRYSQRLQGIYFDNKISIWFDKTFSNDYIHNRFPNLKLINE